MLGPILFSIYINELPDSLITIPHIQAILYADDINVVVSTDNRHDLLAISQQISMLVDNWSDANFLRLNTDKTQLIYFHNKGKHSFYIPVLLENKLIPQVQSTKFLGIHIDSDLSWNSQISNLASRISTYCFFIS